MIATAGAIMYTGCLIAIAISDGKGREKFYWHAALGMWLGGAIMVASPFI